MQPTNSMGGMNGASFQEMQRLQQQMQQQQQFRPQQGQQQMMAVNSFAQGGMNTQQQHQPHQLGSFPHGQMNSNTALAFMQQQQPSQQHMNSPNPMVTTNSQNAMFSTANSSWNGGMAGPVTMDASTGSSARLMAMAGMGGGAFVGGAMGNQQTTVMNSSGATSGNKMMGTGNLMDSSRHGGGNSSKTQNMQILLQHQNSQNQGLTGGSFHGGAATASQRPVPYQQQLSSLQQSSSAQPQGMNASGQHLQDSNSSMNMLQMHQQQLLQQMQAQHQGKSRNVSAMQNVGNTMGMVHPVSTQQHQNAQFSQSNMNMHLTQGAVAGTLDEQTLRLHQQNLLLSSAGTNSGRSSKEPQSNPQNAVMMQQQQQHPQQMQQAQQFHQGSTSMAHPGSQRNSPFPQTATMNDGSLNSGSQRSNSSGRQTAPTNIADNRPQQSQKSFLDGSFAGGWQSNDDLPDRRQVIFRILEVIRQMRPDANGVPPDRFPHMAKTLEEHLYRSASTKEEYMDFATLRQRLQGIAQHLEFHRGAPGDSTSSGTSTFPQQNTGSGMPQGAMGGMGAPGGDLGQRNAAPGVASGSGMNNSSSHSMGGGMTTGASLSHHQSTASHSQGVSNMNPMQQSSSSSWTGTGMIHNSMMTSGSQHSNIQHSSQELAPDFSSNQQAMQGRMMPPLPVPPQANSGNYQAENGDMNVLSASLGPLDADPPQKKKVILQQQQRLLLLRHASKCKAGPSCRTKFCAQMVALWRHMKSCKNRNCDTPHCYSSRCVLHHYRVCKSNGRTATCEVCGPVMNRIRQLERDDGAGDPLTRDDTPPSSQHQQLGANNVYHAMDAHPSDEAQLQQVQAQQAKLKAQLDSLKQLQKRQDDLLKQQRRLEVASRQVKDPNSVQAQQNHQQQLLLQNLQQKCQQQQQMLQKEVQMQMQMGMDSSSSMPLQQNSVSTFNAFPPGGFPEIAPAQDVPLATQSTSKPRRSSETKKKRKPRKAVRHGKGKSLGLGTIVESPPQKKEISHPSGDMGGTVGSDPLGAMNVGSAMPPKTPLSENSSLIPFMSNANIQKHLDSLNKQIRLSSRTVTHKCLPLVQALIDDPYGWVFHDAVDPVALGLPDYFEVVKTPMHLDLVKKKLENAIYSDMEVFARDARLVFENAILYNGDASEVGQLAQSMLTKFNESYLNLVHEIESSHSNLEKNGEICSLCGMQNRKFEPAVLYCQGECKMQRINRGATYYTDRTKQNHWCGPCFSALPPEESILLDDGSEINKNELQSFKNDALPEEGWVNCDECDSWVHQVCGLFNGRTNKSTASYRCPNCHLKHPDNGNVGMEKLVKTAKDLPHCKMSEAIERGVYNALEQAYKERASELGIPLDEVERAEGLSIRVVSNSERKHVVGEKMLARYKDRGCATEFPVRTKCIALFQEIHGVDTLLFAVYVYEYGEESAAPNRRRVYISYLDSVQYFEPKVYRTTTYHSILIEYLRFVKRRGFHTAHIWSCPPTAGDDYIFYSHPPNQLIPRDDMLRAWYHRLLERAKVEGIVLRTTTLFDEYFVRDGVNAVSWATGEPTCLPYFEGDYIPGEIENIIKLEEEGLPKPSDISTDSVMARLGHNLSKMKDNFIVVHLRSRRFVEAVHKGEDVTEWKEDSDEEVVRSKRAKISGKDSNVDIPKNMERFLQSSESVEQSSEAMVVPADVVGDQPAVATDKSSAPAENVEEGKTEESSSQPNENPDNKSDPTLGKTEETSKESHTSEEVNTTTAPTVESSTKDAGTPTQPSADHAQVRTEPSQPATEDMIEDATEIPNTEGTKVDMQPSPQESTPPTDPPTSLPPITGDSGETGPTSTPPAEESTNVLKTSSPQVPDTDTMRADVPTNEAMQVDKPSDDQEVVHSETTNELSSETPPHAAADTVEPEAKAEEAMETEIASDETPPTVDESVKTPAVTVDATPVVESVQERSNEAKDAEDSLAAEETGVTSTAVLPPPLEVTPPAEEPRVDVGDKDPTESSTPEVKPAGNETATATTTDTMDTEQPPPPHLPTKRGLDEIRPAITRHFESLTRRPDSVVSDTHDEDEPLEVELFESRQRFLNYCQSAHCQFDQLRRAKHSTMMVLFQLHNPTAPLFLHQCGSCYRDIVNTVRYHCNTCSNFDLCSECYKPVTTGEWAARDARYAHDPSHSFEAMDMENDGDVRSTAVVKNDSFRRDSLQAHVALLEHAGSCPGDCGSQNCHRLKELFAHVEVCRIKPVSECRICTRLLSLCAVHARTCSSATCPIPFCDRIRERNLRLRRQQQMMDDRRRQAQNDLYHAQV